MASQVNGQRDMAGMKTQEEVHGIKAQEFLCLRSLLGDLRHQPRLFLCYYTANKLLYGTRCLRPAVRPVRKPGLTLSWVCRESSEAPVRSLELPAVKELWSQKLKSLALGE